MPMPKVKESCVLAVLQKATHSGTMGDWAVDWLDEFTERQPALASQLCAWIEHCSEGVPEEALASLTATIGILIKSIESQIECDELAEGLPPLAE